VGTAVVFDRVMIAITGLQSTDKFVTASRYSARS